ERIAATVNAVGEDLTHERHLPGSGALGHAAGARATGGVGYIRRGARGRRRGGGRGNRVRRSARVTARDRLRRRAIVLLRARVRVAGRHGPGRRALRGDDHCRRLRHGRDRRRADQHRGETGQKGTMHHDFAPLLVGAGAGFLPSRTTKVCIWNFASMTAAFGLEWNFWAFWLVDLSSDTFTGSTMRVMEPTLVKNCARS